MSLVSLTVSDGIATVRMDDPDRRNVLGPEMLSAMLSAFDRIPDDCRAVVLGARGSVWCAGFDIKELGPGVDPLAPGGRLQELFSRIERHPAPVIAMLGGSCWGGGTDLALRCDMRIGDGSAGFAFTPAKLGLPYDLSGIWNAIWCAGPAVALEMFATGERIGAERALAAGLLNRLVAAEALEAETYRVAAAIAANAPLSVRSAKLHIRALCEAAGLATGARERLDQSRAQALASEDFKEGLAAFWERRPARFAGA